MRIAFLFFGIGLAAVVYSGLGLAWDGAYQLASMLETGTTGTAFGRYAQLPLLWTVLFISRIVHDAPLLLGASVLINRVRSIPSADTFDVPPIGEFVKRYLRNSKVSVDPFARNKRWATYTNDLNPETAAEYHLPADEFLQTLKDKGVIADLVIFDPPYSRRQVKEVYEGIGLHFTNDDSQYYSSNWKKERALINDILSVGGHVLSFGWNTSGMGSFSNFTEKEILIVCHGGSRYDTLCIAEKKTAYQSSLFTEAHLTQHAPDAGDSAASTSLIHASALSASEGITNPPQRR